MSDVETAVAVLHAATEPARFRLLAHACAHGGFRASEAAEIAGLDPKDGTARSFHAALLELHDLLERKSGPVRFEATTAGVALYRALIAAAGTTGLGPPSVDQVALLLVMDASTFEQLRLEPLDQADLVATLARRAKRTVRQAALRVTRIE